MKNMHNLPILAIVVPCYNEQEVLLDTAQKLSQKVRELTTSHLIAEQSFIAFVDDGSRDTTWSLIEKLHTEQPHIYTGIKMSRNKGHQNALLCGLHCVKDIVDVAVSIDADLQDDIDVIDRMIVKYSQGCEIVYGVRSDRTTDSFFKRTTAQMFYSLLKVLGVNIVYNHADFRLMGREALNALSEYQEVNLFLRGIVPLLGYQTGIEYYARSERMAGTTKYPLRKMLSFAFEGITSFSTRPIRFISILGVYIFCISIAFIIYFFYRHITGHTVIGWSSVIVSLWGIGGLILLSIGIVGEYIGKIYLETKRRPLYHIEKKLCGQSGSEKVET